MKRDQSIPRARRPLSVMILLFIYLWVSLSGWIRMLYSILSWYWLDYAGVEPGPLYLAVTGGLWGLMGLAALVWVWRRSPGYRLAGLAGALIYAAMYWIDRLLFAGSENVLHNTTFAAAATILGLGYVLAALEPWQEFKLFRGR